MNRLLSIVRPVLLSDFLPQRVRLPRLFSGWVHPKMLRLFLITTGLFALELYLVIKFFF
ncbi:hypothetical protein [Spirosoma validum]|uniref:Uncharacterized protein n=1 Tax=Spirosoma validum TaxID=2771355 RepID=A0A927AZN8_9BACT|nr:hypothetical protein [Spirosoma validum]MBD2752688.1 hypothetical protein [Spirosoma validum]